MGRGSTHESLFLPSSADLIDVTRTWISIPKRISLFSRCLVPIYVHTRKYMPNLIKSSRSLVIGKTSFLTNCKMCSPPVFASLLIMILTSNLSPVYSMVAPAWTEGFGLEHLRQLHNHQVLSVSFAWCFDQLLLFVSRLMFQNSVAKGSCLKA